MLNTLNGISHPVSLRLVAEKCLAVVDISSLSSRESLHLNYYIHIYYLTDFRLWAKQNTAGGRMGRYGYSERK